MPITEANHLVLVVACALVDADGRVLVAQGPTGRSMAGMWEFPGGKVEAGETPEAALVRDLAKELGIGQRSRNAIVRRALAPPNIVSVKLPQQKYSCM